MSNTDSFIDEVNEELKRERMVAWLKKYGWIAVLAVLLVVGGAAWNEWNKAQTAARAEAFGDAVFAALNETDVAARQAALAALANEGTGARDTGRTGILNLLVAGQALEAGDRPAALAALQAVADDGALPASYRQLAVLKRVIIAGADLPVSEREALLQPLAQAGQAFRPLALEQLALLQVEAGARDDALARFSALLEEPDVTSALRERVQQMIIILGGANTADFG
ncbi:MAG: tetratricopeptide repeat protein [Pararhodobacter sp.]|nr:tetratricopeptide repeat protein [Pararhodobacter sp.]